MFDAARRPVASSSHPLRKVLRWCRKAGWPACRSISIKPAWAAITWRFCATARRWSTSPTLAEAVGYRFTVAFRDATGLSPGRYAQVARQARPAPQW